MNRFSTEVYFFNRRWRFALWERGPLGQPLERLITRPCRNKKDAHQQAREALIQERNKRNAS